MIFNWLHWTSFPILRFVLSPALVVRFWQVLEAFPLWQRVWVCGSQVALCGFNCLFLHAILTRRKVYSSLASAFSSDRDLKSKA